MEQCNKLQEVVTQQVIDVQTGMPTYVINDQVTMAGQPQPADWSRLAQAGYDMIINIRSDAERAAQQAQRAQAAGLDYLHLPLPVYELETPHLERFHDTLSDALETHRRVLLHCRTASRTALLWMLNRITYDGWSQDQAERELAQAGYEEDDMEVFQFCAEDYFERSATAV